MSSETAARYRQLLDAGPAPTDALCWTVVQPGGRPVDVDEVARRLGGDPAVLVDHVLGDGDDDRLVYGDGHERAFRLAAVGPAVAMVEFHGYQGANPRVLRALSVDALVHSAFWNIEGASRFSYAVDGRVLTAFDGNLPGSRWGEAPDALSTDLDQLLATARGGGGDSRGAMLALIERRTGVALTAEWLKRPHRVLLARPLPA
ncbi:hypothetical protein Val02_84240 [Virgisporangium aliadipatigenens]|uniref:Uncharacterized protein n=1 Tax=Virgisporangium aliadipatigenens TaxID=741659 RepID=A0A8J4DVU6_9ACTN|nr:DUF6461 domain-containing protein [Virgisporangium aliadipatigenens]GIJ51538.1 hypothetical protein Val02_84240 [Virgisporangium aliadipatigenens]